MGRSVKGPEVQMLYADKNEDGDDKKDDEPAGQKLC